MEATQMDLATARTLWLALGCLLMAAEMLSGTFVLLCIGMGALITGLLLSLGLDLGFNAQLIIAALSSALSLWLLRKPLLDKFGKSAGFDEHAGQKVKVLSWSGQEGRVRYRGSDWTAKSTETLECSAQTELEIERVDGLTLWVRP
jgi:membrane protein implicated in regulation of membrane protease activity